MFDFLIPDKITNILDGLKALLALLTSGLILYFFSGYIIFILNWFSTKFPNLIIIVVLVLILNLAGTLVAYTVFHINASIALAIAPYSTAGTVSVVTLGFSGLFFATIGILVYKLLK